jgi:cytochrome P450
MGTITAGLGSLILHNNPIPWLVNILERSQSSMTKVPLPGKRAYWLVADPSLANAILTNRRGCDKGGPLYAILNDALGDEGLFTVNGHDLWRTLRERMNPSFAKPRFPEMVSFSARTWNALMNEWDTAEPIPMFAQFKRSNSELLVNQLFGGQVGGRDIVDLAEPVFEQMATQLFSPQSRITGMSRDYRAAITRMETQIYALIRARRQGIQSRTTPRPPEDQDMLDRLMTATGRRLTDKQIRDQVFIFFLAGFDSTATGLAWSVIRLAESPDLYTRLQREVRQAITDPREIAPTDFRNTPTLAAFLTTVLEDYPPFRIYFRNVVTAQTVDDHQLRPGDQIIVMSKEARVPFGAGGRKCIGESLARMNSLTTLAIILHRTESLTRPDKNSGTEFTYSMITPPKDGALINVTLAPARGRDSLTGRIPHRQPERWVQARRTD